MRKTMAGGTFRFGLLHEWIPEHLVPLARSSRFSFVILSEAKDLCHLRRTALVPSVLQGRGLRMTARKALPQLLPILERYSQQFHRFAFYSLPSVCIIRPD
jgi:hypothetical protein